MCIESTEIRFIVVKGTIYVRKEDIISYIKTLAATEETDVRDRLNHAADNLERFK